jgi:dihydrofolate reductase
MPNFVYIATSLDGFIAREDGGLDWLPQVEAAGEGGSGEDFGYADFLSGIDAIIMGRHSIEVILSFGAWPYTLPVIVLSTTMKSAPNHLKGKVEIYKGPIETLLKRLHSEGKTNLYIDGGKTIQSFLEEDLIDEMIITTIPVLLGDGIPLFGTTPQDIPFVHKGTEAYGNGMVKSHYVRKREDATE